MRRAVRRNFLVPVPAVKSFEELNDYLLRSCLKHGSHRIAGRTENIDSLFEKEKEYLLPLPAVPLANIALLETRVDKYSTAIVDKNRYSVPRDGQVLSDNPRGVLSGSLHPVIPRPSPFAMY